MARRRLPDLSPRHAVQGVPSSTPPRHLSAGSHGLAALVIPRGRHDFRGPGRERTKGLARIVIVPHRCRCGRQAARPPQARPPDAPDVSPVPIQVGPLAIRDDGWADLAGRDPARGDRRFCGRRGDRRGVGGWLGQALVDEPVFMPAHPAEIQQVWKGDVSFRAGPVGIALADGCSAAGRPRSARAISGARRARRARAPGHRHRRRSGGWVTDARWGMAFRGRAAHAIPCTATWPSAKSCAGRRDHRLFLVGDAAACATCELVREPDDVVTVRGSS